MKGYLFNTLLVASGSMLGLAAGKKLRDDIKDAVFNVLGLITVFVGVRMTMSGADVIPVVFCLVLGTLVGSAFRLEDRVNRAIKGLNDFCFPTNGQTEGFVIASTLFCVGSMTIIGSLKDGLYNDGTLIRTKSIMDGFASFLLASRYGRSVAYSAVTVFVVQGALTLFSGSLTFLTAERMMQNIDGVGGVIVLAIGLNLLAVKKIKTIDMLPALILIVLYGVWFS